MRKTTLRFTDRQHSYIAAAASAQGVTLAQYVREAALARAVFEGAISGEDSGMAAMAANALELERLSDELRAEARGR